MMPVRLEPAALLSRVKHSTTEPLRSYLLDGDQQEVLISLSMGTLAGASPKYSRTCVKGRSKIDKTKILMTNGSLMKVKSIAEFGAFCITFDLH